MAKARNVTAFELDPAVVGDTDAHPFTLAPFPGLWQVGRPMSPEALGLSVTEMRGLIARFNLPLVEVKVPEGKAETRFPLAPQQIESGTATVEKPGGVETFEAKGTTYQVPRPPTTELQPTTLQAMATATARADAAEGGEGDYAEAVEQVAEGHDVDASTVEAVQDAGEAGTVEA